jgi:hypothetical protein
MNCQDFIIAFSLTVLVGSTCLGQFFQGEIKYVFESPKNIDTISTYYRKDRTKSGLVKTLWEYGLYESYVDYNLPPNVWYTYDKIGNKLKRNTDTTYVNDKITKLDSIENYMGHDCELYKVILSDLDCFGHKCGRTLIIYSSDLKLKLPSGWNHISPLYSVNGRITLKCETIVYFDGEEYGRNLWKAIEIDEREIDDDLLLPPKDAVKID